jgi:hypothetical protein
MSRSSDFAAARRAYGVWQGSVVLAIVLAWAATSQAAIFLSATLIKSPVSGTPFGPPAADAALGAPWFSYKLSLTATGASTIQAVDVSITGPIHQKWTSSSGDGVYDTPSPSSTSLTSADSHLLIPNNGIVGTPATEDNSLTGSPLTDNDSTGWGIGHSLSGAWAVNGIAVTSLDLAYIAARPSDFSQLQVSVTAADPTGQKYPKIVTGGSPPNLLVLGNGMAIANRENMPSLADGTDFGTVPQGSTQTRTFNAIDFDPFFSLLPIPLALGAPTFTGPFSLVGTFPSPSFSGGPFTIGLDTSVPGTYTGSISFPSNDPFNDPFTFALAARVVPEPASVMLAAGGAIGFIGLVVGCRR